MSRGGRAALALTGLAILGVPAGAAAGGAAGQRLVVLHQNAVARATPGAHARAVEAVSAHRPLTGAATVLPVLGTKRAGGRTWIRVRLPGRPNGHTGWIATSRTTPTGTEWALRVDISERRVSVLRDGLLERRFPAVVGKPSTPTPTGTFFVEEAVALGPRAPGAPFALATSARSGVLQEFDGGPGQIALHGTGNIPGALGTAVSHGCVRLGSSAITWLAHHVGSGTPVTIVP